MTLIQSRSNLIVKRTLFNFVSVFTFLILLEEKLSKGLKFIGFSHFWANMGLIIMTNILSI